MTANLTVNRTRRFVPSTWPALYRRAGYLSRTPGVANRSQNMELKDFVAQTLIHISEGVVEAQQHLHKTGGRVNPRLRNVLPKGEKNYAPLGWAEGEGGNPILMVNFDVAVTASEGTKTKGGIGVITGIVSLGSTGATDRGNTSASRIAFQMPLMLPAHPSNTENPA